MNVLILTVLLAVAQTGAPVPRQAADGSTSNSQNTDKQANTKQKPPNRSLLVPSKKQAPSPEEHAKEQDDRNTDQSIRVTELPSVSVKDNGFNWQGWTANILLLVVSILQIYLLFWTLKVTERAADAAKTSAEAVINGERAWMLVKDIDGPKPIEEKIIQPRHAAGIVFLNYGKTVAKLTAWRFELALENIGTTPSKNLYELPQIAFVPNMIAPEQDAPYTAEISYRDFSDMRTATPKKILWFCGFLQYEDAFGKVHKTKVCYFYDTEFRPEPRFRLGGPREYNEAN